MIDKKKAAPRQECSPRYLQKHFTRHLSAEQLAFALDGKKAGKGYQARCPAHDDRSPSLSIAEKNGRVLFRCWAGCSQDDVLRVLKARHLWPEEKKPAQVRNLKSKAEISAFIDAHENNLKSGIPTTTKAQQTYRQYQRIKYAPFTADEVFEMHAFCLCYRADIRKGLKPSADDDAKFREYSRTVYRLGVPYEW